jgi:hypothetical protein
MTGEQPAGSQSMSKEAAPRLWIEAGCIAILCALLAFALQPRIGILDSDAVGYLLGAKSIQAGHGYRDLSGQPLNHWPPAYSFLLSFFSDPLAASLAINYLSLGLAAGLVHLLLRSAGWNLLPAASASTVFGAGFFRLLAVNAKPDVLTYAAFLAGALLYRTRTRAVFGAHLLWGVLIWFKLIAVAFGPAAILVELLIAPRQWRSNLSKGILCAAVWCIALSSIVAFNYATQGEAISSSHPSGSIAGMIGSAKLLGFSIVRSLLWSWYGSVRSVPVLAAFACMLAVACGSLLTLRRNVRENRLLYFALIVVGLSLALSLARKFDTNARLLGYGLVLLPAAFRPARKLATPLWVSYGVMALVAAMINGKTTNSLGANDPRYVVLAAEAREFGTVPTPVCSNAFRVLDVHEGIATRPVSSPNEVHQCKSFVLFKTSSYDSLASTVSEVAAPTGWCREAERSALELWTPCLTSR